MSTGLALYDAACRALAEATRIDEVEDIRDKSLAMQIYAEQTKNHSLVQNTIALRLRAERRMGELLREMKDRGERDSGKGNRNPALKSQAATPKLSDLGVTKSQSSRWQRLADIDANIFKTATRKPHQPTTRGERSHGKLPVLDE
jgi:hypothetical protein